MSEQHTSLQEVPDDPLAQLREQVREEQKHMPKWLMCLARSTLEAQARDASGDFNL